MPNFRQSLRFRQVTISPGHNVHEPTVSAVALVKQPAITISRSTFGTSRRQLATAAGAERLFFESGDLHQLQFGPVSLKPV